MAGPTPQVGVRRAGPVGCWAGTWKHAKRPIPDKFEFSAKALRERGRVTSALTASRKNHKNRWGWGRREKVKKSSYCGKKTKITTKQEQQMEIFWHFGGSRVQTPPTSTPPLPPPSPGGPGRWSAQKKIPQENAKIEISLQKKVDTGIVFLASCILGTSSWVEAASFRQTPTHQKNIYLELSTDSKYKPPKI